MASRARRRAPLVAVEGIDGAGKSSLLSSLAGELRRRGWKVGRWSEPSDGVLGRAARKASGRDPAQAAFLFTLDRGAERAKLQELRGTSDLVLSDRSYFSTLAYQGSALGAEERRALERLQKAFAEPPDRVLWLDLPPEIALERVDRRGSGRSSLEKEAVLRRTAKAYAAYARKERRRFVRLDARKDPGEVLRAAMRALAPLLRSRPRGDSRRAASRKRL